MTYEDGVADVNSQKMLKVHRESGKILTLTGIRPHGRFGALEIDGDKVGINNRLRLLI